VGIFQRLAGAMRPGRAGALQHQLTAVGARCAPHTHTPPSFSTPELSLLDTNTTPYPLIASYRILNPKSFILSFEP
jgi:hypothetical protein